MDTQGCVESGGTICNCHIRSFTHETFRTFTTPLNAGKAAGDAKDFNANLLRRFKDVKGGLRTGVSSGASASCFCDDPFVKRVACGQEFAVSFHLPDPTSPPSHASSMIVHWRPTSASQIAMLCRAQLLRF